MSNKRSIGVVAGGGDLPLLCVKKIRELGHLPYVVALSGEVSSSSELSHYAEDILSVPLGKISKPLSFFKSHGVQEVVIVGGVRRQGLFLRLRPDFKAVRLLASLIDKRDDSLLRAVSSVIEADGIKIIGVQSLLPELAIQKGNFTSRVLSDQEQQNALLAWQVLETLGACDVGQSVVAFEGSIVAVEGIEGTDALIARAGELAARRGGVLVKKIKKSQDTRLDNPTIGVATIESMAKAGLTALVLGAGGAVVVNPQAVLEVAQKYNIAIEAR
jgi:DUF1009 family protein